MLRPRPPPKVQLCEVDSLPGHVLPAWRAHTDYHTEHDLPLRAKDGPVGAAALQALLLLIRHARLPNRQGGIQEPLNRENYWYGVVEK